MMRYILIREHLVGRNVLTAGISTLKLLANQYTTAWYSVLYRPIRAQLPKPNACMPNGCNSLIVKSAVSLGGPYYSPSEHHNR